MVAFRGTLDTVQIEDPKIIKEKLTDGKKLFVGLETNQFR